MTALVRRLESAGWAERSPNPDDERAWVVRITGRGRRLLEEVEPSYFEKIDRMFGAQSESDLRRFSRQLERTRVAMEREAAV